METVRDSGEQGNELLKPNPSAMVEVGKIRSTKYLQTKLWRQANPEKYREYMREYMKRRRNGLHLHKREDQRSASDGGAG